MITVVVASFGAEEWAYKAIHRAWPTAHTQAPSVLVHHSEGTLATARNAGAAEAKSGWLCFLDADDQLADGYVEHMAVAIRKHGASDRLFTPRVQYMRNERRAEGGPFFHPQVSPSEGNWLVIGTVVPKALFDDVGGFEEWPMYEDWALFARMQKSGAQVQTVPDAIYRAFRHHPAGQSRNHAGGTTAKVAARDMIRRAVFPELYEEAT